MILHFLTDDKFSDYVLSQFASYEMHSEFLVISEIRILKNISRRKDLMIINPNSEDFKRVVNELSVYHAIVFHGLFWPWEEYVLRNIPKQVKVAWMFWGGEIYGRKDLKYSFLAPKTKRVQLWKDLKCVIKHKGERVYPYEMPKDLFERIDYCLTDIFEEYQFAKEYLGNRMVHLWYNYYSIEETLGEAKDLFTNGNNILIGNSGTIQGNHFDTFYRINKRYLRSNNIIVPISYGETWVINRIIKVGERRFKNAFTPLKVFLCRNDYNRILSSCRIVIMPHYRPQAFGNIITSLWLGARVYMSEKSLQYSYLKRIGVILFSIEKDLYKDLASSVVSLTDDAVMENRRILYAHYSLKTVETRVMELVTVLNS